MRNRLLLMYVAGLVVTIGPGCATKKLVRGQAGEINSKVDSIATALEDTQERTTKTEQRIGQVDQKVEAVNRSAAAARRTADNAAKAAKNADSRIARLDAWGRRLIHDVTLSEEQGEFEFGGAELPGPVRARIEDLVSDLVANPTGVYIEIEGHTDNVGSPDANRRLGLARAESAKRYIHEQFSVPLHKINVISFGEDRPAASNRTADGRARNRRIDIRVLSKNALGPGCVAVGADLSGRPGPASRPAPTCATQASCN